MQSFTRTEFSKRKSAKNKKQSKCSHSFQLTVYQKYTVCDYCERVLWGILYQGYQCSGELMHMCTIMLGSWHYMYWDTYLLWLLHIKSGQTKYIVLLCTYLCVHVLYMFKHCHNKVSFGQSVVMIRQWVTHYLIVQLGVYNICILNLTLIFFVREHFHVN